LTLSRAPGVQDNLGAKMDRVPGAAGTGRQRVWGRSPVKRFTGDRRARLQSAMALFAGQDSPLAPTRHRWTTGGDICYGASAEDTLDVTTPVCFCGFPRPRVTIAGKTNRNSARALANSMVFSASSLVGNGASSSA
jgi:hypothetical protein